MSIDFFISYTAIDRPWAVWIAATLEDAGYTTVVQAWDFRPGQNFVERMDRAMRESVRTIAVVSRDYYRSAYAVPEWTNAVTRDPTGRRGVLLPVRIDDVVLEGIFAAVTWIDLVGVDRNEAVARKRLIDGLGRERVKPSGTPGFPEGERPRFPGALPPVWRVPHDRNPAFAGRDDLLAELRDGLANMRMRPAIAALTGTGGIGKTAIAVEHCYRASCDYQVVWWIRAAQREFATADLAALAEPLGIRKGEETGSAADLAADLAAVRHWLDQHDQWLLVLDEAEHGGIIRGVIPQGGGGHIIVTSRDPAWRREAGIVRGVPVLELPSSLRLLELRTGLEPDHYADALAGALGHLPLALELAGAFVERQGLGFRDYLLRLERAGGIPESGEGAPPDYRHTLATVWSESLGALEQHEPVAGDLLRLCSYLAPDDLPRSAVRAGAASLPEPLKDRALSSEALANLVALPRAYSLLTTHADGISMHRLLQVVLRSGLDDGAQRRWAGAAVAMMQRGFPLQAADTRLWERSGRLLPHAVAAAGHAEGLAVESEATLHVLDRAASYVVSTETDSAEAATYRDRALALAERVHGCDNVPGWLLNNHGLWLFLKGKPDAARPLLERAIAQEEARGVSAGLGTFYVNLADLERQKKDFEAAKKFLRRGVAILDRHVVRPHPNVATAHSKLGQVLTELGELEEAEHEFRRAVELYEATLGPGALDTITARSWLEGVRSPGRVPEPWFATEVIGRETIARNKGKALVEEPAYGWEAEERLREATASGDAAALFHLSQLLEKVPGREPEAAAFLERAVAAGVPEALYWHGRHLVEKPGREAEAERTIRAAIAAGQTYAWYDLGLLLARDPLRRAEAEAAFRAALDSGYEEARNDLGLLLLGQAGRQAEGEEALRETGRRGHARGYHNLGQHLGEQGRNDEAIEIFQAAISGGYRRSHLDLGIVLDRVGRRREAEREFRAAIAAGEPRGHWNLAILFDIEGRPAEAEGAYRAAVAAGVKGAAARLGKLLAQQPGREAEAAECFVRITEAGDPDGWLLLAELTSRLPGREELAEGGYRNAIDAGLVMAWNNLGIFLAGLPGREQDAEVAFIEAVRTGHPEGWYNLGVHLRSQPGRDADAARAEAFAQAHAGREALAKWPAP